MTQFYLKAIACLEKTGVQIYGSRFRVLEEDHHIIQRLLAWSLKDATTAKQLGIDLTKGLMITGPIGCGKSALINLMRYFIKDAVPHILKPCREVAFEFEKVGFEIIRRYASVSYHSTTNRPYLLTYCFDDLGTEQSLRHFGQECNIMAEIILSRYDLFIRKKMITHFTTNLSADEIEKLYGPRVRSRLREMCNLIAFPKDTPDKRR
jgi:DNA replication protein DnaC